MPNVVKGQITDRIRSAYLTQHRRRQYPASYFLLVKPNGERLFPYKDPDGGAIHCGLLRAAITRAAQHGYRSVETKARELYERHCKEGVRKEAEVVWKDGEGREVFGAVLVPGQKDSDGHVFTKEEVERACREYNRNFGNLGYRHVILLDGKEAQVLESYCLPVEMEIGGKTYPEGTWMMRVEVEDEDLRELVRKGELVGFSVGGVMWKDGGCGCG